MEEEPGCAPASGQLLNAATTPGYCTEHIAMYLATTCRATSGTDQDEFLRGVHPLEEAVPAMLSGELTDMNLPGPVDGAPDTV